MKHWIRAALTIGFALFMLAPVPPGAIWRDRGDRQEGILRRQDVSGAASLRLEGAELKPGARPDVSDDQLYVWLPREAGRVVRVDIRERRSNYLMRPKPDRLTAGTAFVWPTAEVIRRARVNVGRLRVKAIDADRVLYPALLSSGPVVEPTRFLYEFICAASSGFSVEWRISRFDDGSLEPVVRGDRRETQPGLIRFAWDGVANDGEVATPGMYELAIQGEDDRGRSVDLRENFWNYGVKHP